MLSFNNALVASILVAGITPSLATNLFDFEKQQLNRRNLATLKPLERGWFDFDKGLPNPHDAERCRPLPDDPHYPNEDVWERVMNVRKDQYVVQAASPQAKVCYTGEDYDEADCQYLLDNWSDPHLQTKDPIEVLAPVYQGMTCQATNNKGGQCTLGGYPSWVVNASAVADIQMAVNFARNKGLRLIVKNTGHDFIGRSAGAGAVSIWTHNLKDIKYIPKYRGNGTDYNGPAFKVAAGVQGFEIYKAAREHNLVVIGGECETVGIFGGYTQGGGHSPLSSLYGLGADQVLSVKVVTADGRFVTASPTKNKDLFWAVRGGGGGSWGVVTSMIVKAYPDTPVTASSFKFATSPQVKPDAFFRGLRSYLDFFKNHTDAGIYAYYDIKSLPHDNYEFIMRPFLAPNKTVEETNKLLEPWIAKLNESGIDVCPKTTKYPNFLDAFNSEFVKEPVMIPNASQGSRLLPRSAFADRASLDKVFAAIRQNLEHGRQILGYNFAPDLERAGNPDNAVNPAWREALGHIITHVGWDQTLPAEQIAEIQKRFTDGDMKALRDATPGSGAYLSEADVNEPNWQQSFFGDNYEKLVDIKKRYDPHDLFYTMRGVGSDKWQVETEDGLPHQNGRLCRTNLLPQQGLGEDLGKGLGEGLGEDLI